MVQLATAVDTARLYTQWAVEELARPRGGGAGSAGRAPHLALFAWALPPNSNAGVYRPLSFVRYGTQLGWRIDAFCGEAPANQRQHGEELVARIPALAKLHVVQASQLRPAYRLSTYVDGGFANALANARHARHVLASDPPDVVLASGPPFHSFVAGFLVARQFKVPLVLDYRDEWTECPFDFVSRGRGDRWWERRCLGGAEAVLFTTKSHIEHQLDSFPMLSRARVHLVPNGWEPSDFPAEPNFSWEALDQEQVVNVAHVGALGGHASPGEFLGVLAELLSNCRSWRSRLVLNFVGRASPAAKAEIASFPFRENVRIVDHVGKSEAANWMRQASILLLLATPGLARYLPGKLFDYLAARRPILVFGAPGEASSLVSSLSAGLLCNVKAGASLNECLNNILALPTPDKARTDMWLEEHRRDYIAAKCFEIIGSLAPKSSVSAPELNNKPHATESDRGAMRWRRPPPQSDSSPD